VAQQNKFLHSLSPIRLIFMSPLLSTENRFSFGASVSGLMRRLSTDPLHSVAAMCVALLLSAPFLLPVNGLPVHTFYQEWTAIALGCAAFLAILLAQGKTGVEVPRMVLLPLGILLLLLVQMAQGRLIYWQQGAVAAMYLLWSVAMMYVGSALRRRIGWDGLCRLSAWAVCLGALLSAVIGVFQLAGWQLGGLVVPMTGARVHGNLGQANHFADYLSLGLIATIYLVCTRRMNLFAAGGAIVLLLTMANWSGSRSVWLYLASAVLLATWVYRGERSTRTQALVIWAGAAVVALLVVKLVFGIFSDEVTLRPALDAAHSATVEARPSPRLAIWLAALLMIKSAPLAGVGFDGFAWNYFLLAGLLPAGIPEEITDNAHNLVLHFFAEFGLPGGILLIGAAVVWWLAQFRQKVSIHCWWVLSLVAIVCLHSLLEYPLWYAHFLGLFALIVGAGDRTVWRVGPASGSRIVVAALCTGIVWTLASVFNDYRRVERLGVVSEAGRLQSEVHSDAVNVSRSTLFPDIVELGLSRTISVDRNALEAKLELNGRVLRTYPASDVAYRQSALLALAGDLPAAYRLWDLAIAAYPGRAMKVTENLAKSSSMGQAQLAPLLEYAASRTEE
jgi:O-antigen ligase